MSNARHEAPVNDHMGGLYPPEKWTETVLWSIINESMSNQHNCWKPNAVEHKFSNSQVNEMLANGLELFDSKSESHSAPHSERASDNLKESVQVPGVGDVACVDMKKSHEITQNADHELAGRDPHTYNCMYYVKTVMEGHAPKRPGDPTHMVDGATEGMPNSQFMKDHGFSKAPHGELKTGDVVLISIPNPNGGVPTEHAGIVIGKDKNGEPIIRQKPDGEHPPIDLTQSQFEACYCQGQTIEQQRAAHHAGVFRKDA